MSKPDLDYLRQLYSLNPETLKSFEQALAVMDRLEDALDTTIDFSGGDRADSDPDEAARDGAYLN
jgi:hypothetical protein